MSGTLESTADGRSMHAGAQGISDLAKAIAHNSSVLDLTARRTQPELAGIIAISDCLISNASIQYLDLSENHIGA